MLTLLPFPHSLTLNSPSPIYSIYLRSLTPAVLPAVCPPFHPLTCFYVFLFADCTVVNFLYVHFSLLLLTFLYVCYYLLYIHLLLPFLDYVVVVLPHLPHIISHLVNSPPLPQSQTFPHYFTSSSLIRDPNLPHPSPQTSLTSFHLPPKSFSLHRAVATSLSSPCQLFPLLFTI